MLYTIGVHIRIFIYMDIFVSLLLRGEQSDEEIKARRNTCEKFNFIATPQRKQRKEATTIAAITGRRGGDNKGYGWGNGSGATQWGMMLLPY